MIQFYLLPYSGLLISHVEFSPDNKNADAILYFIQRFSKWTNCVLNFRRPVEAACFSVVLVVWLSMGYWSKKDWFYFEAFTSIFYSLGKIWTKLMIAMFYVTKHLINLWELVMILFCFSGMNSLYLEIRYWL